MVSDPFRGKGGKVILSSLKMLVMVLKTRNPFSISHSYYNYEFTSTGILSLNYHGSRLQREKRCTRSSCKWVLLATKLFSVAVQDFVAKKFVRQVLFTAKLPVSETLCNICRNCNIFTFKPLSSKPEFLNEVTYTLYF